MSRPKVAFFDFTSCEGCQVELTNVGQDLMLGLDGNACLLYLNQTGDSVRWHYNNKTWLTPTFING